MSDELFHDEYEAFSCGEVQGTATGLSIGRKNNDEYHHRRRYWLIVSHGIFEELTLLHRSTSTSGWDKSSLTHSQWLNDDAQINAVHPFYTTPRPSYCHDSVRVKANIVDHSCHLHRCTSWRRLCDREGSGRWGRTPPRPRSSAEYSHPVQRTQRR